MRIYLARHALSVSNDEGTWTGQQNVGLSARGIKAQKELNLRFAYPKADVYFSSPLTRCLETLYLIYQRKPDIIVHDFAECSLGILEGVKYTNLDNDENYVDWIKNPDVAIEKGESFNNFKKRTERGFYEVISECHKKNADSAFIMTHGNVMRSVLSRFADSSVSFDSWKIPNGGLYEMMMKNDSCLSLRQLPEFLF